MPSDAARVASGPVPEGEGVAVGGRAGHRAGAGAEAALPDAGPFRDLATTALALARRFRGGGTLWCVSPAWPWHARHVAVEFVHPVVVGTRALPAVSAEGPDVVAALRVGARPGDMVLALGPAGDATVADVRRLLRAGEEAMAD